MDIKKIKPQKLYQTERLSFQARSLNHADKLFSLVDRSREHLKPWMPWAEATLTIGDSRKYLENTLAWWDRFTVFDFSVFEIRSGKMVGSFGLHTLNWEYKTCELGYWLGHDFQGLGYASECVKLGEQIAFELGFHRVLIISDRLNKRSQRVARRNSYKLEATQIDHCIDRGNLRDTVQYVKLLNPAIEGRITENLPAGYSIRVCDADEFNKIVGTLKNDIFKNDTLSVWPIEIQTEQETAKLAVLNEGYRNHFHLYLLLMCGDQLAGWSSGYQDTKESFCMSNSAILPVHRERGLYSNLLDVALRLLTEKGFQRIWSSHTVTNNRIIIPKMKRGFVITGTSFNEMAGSLVHLTYYTSSLRKKIMDFRSGHRTDQQIKDIFKI